MSQGQATAFEPQISSVQIDEDSLATIENTRQMTERHIKTDSLEEIVSGTLRG